MVCLETKLMHLGSALTLEYTCMCTSCQGFFFFFLHSHASKHWFYSHTLKFIDPEFLNEGERVDMLPDPFQRFFFRTLYVGKPCKTNINQPQLNFTLSIGGL